ncbi:hypothetical protein [Arthrobacter sp. N1]|uniref:hypothetical protein n=1 Tax=Arthrobacter sp. N1 TaxID=619291 RepID=UPI003BB0E734
MLTTGRRGLVWTWALMAAALVITLVLPDWSDDGVRRPLLLLCLPAVLGLAGAFLALRAGSLWWALSAAVLGLLLVPLLMVTLVLVSGP